ncbi:MAG TPA: EAL domain-containing protein [Steroidobacteraceae bacterium]
MLARISKKTARAGSGLRRALRRTSGRLGGFLPGIAGRLGVSFAAVAVLATAANLIAEHGGQVISRIQVAPIRRSVPAQISGPHPVGAAAAAAASVSSSLLIEAVDQFEYAIERRANSDTAENAELLNTAGKRLTDRIEALLKGLDIRGGDIRARSLRQRMEALRAVGDDIVHREDERRSLLADYWIQLELIDSQVRQTLDRSAWKIFGRVISRQSLLKLSRDLDDLRRDSIQLNAREVTGEKKDAAASSQRRLGTDLEDNAAGLSRLQGAQWLAELRKTYRHLVEVQSQLSKLDLDSMHGLAPSVQSSQELKTLVRSIGAAAQKPAVMAPEAQPAIAMSQALRSDTMVTPAPPAPSQGHGGALLAAISGAVLLILLGVSINTVRSIVIPLRQFMATTDRLAAGDEEARFARGAIKELDALAISFNRMAESLAEARATNRQYQSALESRVQERTRQLRHLAEHDPLTGLPNRRQLVGYLNAALQRASDTGTRMAVYFIDLDNFKNINDSMGHSFGDLVLAGAAQRLREAAGDTGFAARLGGDEFTVVYENAGDCASVSDFGNELARAFHRPLLIEGRELIVSISGGASIYPEHERGSDALLRAADVALFSAKKAGRARIALFSPELLKVAAAKFSVEQGLRRALERGELELWFQPEVSFASMGATLVEGLLRWRGPDGQYLSPADFLSVAEDSGLIRDINDWVLRSAFLHVAQWHHGEWPDARVAVNVSARQLIDTGFAAKVRELLEEFQLPSRCIEIELTETVLQTEAATVEVLRELRGLGVSVALDDFGTGYSSLASLERLPLTRVKLDRSLIDTIDTSGRSLAIARAIIGLCANLGLEVTAEGIERFEQLAFMQATPGITLQGYLFSRPVQAQQVLTVLQGLRARMEEFLIAVPTGMEARTVMTAQREDAAAAAPKRKGLKSAS